MTNRSNRDAGKLPVALEIKDDLLWVTLKDGRVIGTPLDWYPRLANATPEQLADYELWANGIHWESLDEDISIDGMLMGIQPRALSPQQG